MFQYDAILFDMDGTLLDTVDDITEALNQTLLKRHYLTHSRDKVKSFLGDGAYQLIQKALPEHTEGAVIESVLAEYQVLYDQQANRQTIPFPGVLPMLTALDEAGLKMAIISNKDDLNVRALAKAHFGSLIHTAVGARDDVPLKPAPDSLHTVMRTLGVKPERTLYIGDAYMDYYAAQNAGADCILVRWGYGDPATLVPLSPLFFVSDPAELPMLILHQQEDAP